MTTFADLKQASATLSAIAGLKFSTASHAKLSARAGVIAESRRNGVADGRATLSGTAGVTANGKRNALAHATLSAAPNIESYPTITGEDLLPGYAISSVSMLPLESLSSNYPYTGSDLSRSNAIWLITAADQGPGAQEAEMFELLIAVNQWGITVEYYQTVTDTLTITDSMSYLRMIEVAIYEALVASDSFTTQAEMSIIISEMVTVASALAKDSVYETWAVNANTNASSRYENFNFNSLAKWGNKFMGASADGIFILVGNTDNGTAIPAHILTGNTDIGSQHQKRVPFVYAGVQADTDMSLQVNTDAGQAYAYPLLATPAMETTRAIIGKGMRGRYWQFKLSNSAGGDFTVDRLDAEFTVLKRRI